MEGSGSGAGDGSGSVQINYGSGCGSRGGSKTYGSGCGSGSGTLLKAISRQVNQMSVGDLQKEQIQQNLLLCNTLIQKSDLIARKRITQKNSFEKVT
jgi:hypothetical protein